MTSGASAPGLRESAPIVRIWRNPDFAQFMCGIGPYYVTSWMQRVGVGWLAWELSHSPGWLGMVAAADYGPMILLAPFGGVCVDRSNPVKVLKACVALMTAQALLLSLLTAGGLITIEVLFALSLFTG